MSKEMFLYCLILIFLMSGICNFVNGITANNVRKEYYKTGITANNVRKEYYKTGIKILSRDYDEACKTENKE